MDANPGCGYHVRIIFMEERSVMLIRLSCLLIFSVVCGCSPSELAEEAPKAPSKKIALSYDDGPLGDGPRFSGRERTDALIAQWAEAETGPVAFFVTTRGLDRTEGIDRIFDYAAAGHLIANHSDQHNRASRTSLEDYISDIDRAEARLKVFENRRPWFRFPYLDEGGSVSGARSLEKRDALRAALDQRGLLSGYVTVDTYDWHLDSLWSDAVRNGKDVNMEALSRVYVEMVVDAAEHYDDLALRVLHRRPVQVLLLHENDLAASFTIKMVDALRANGWEIVDPDIAFADPIAAQLPKTLFSGMGRISALAVDRGMTDRQTLDHWSVSRAAIESRIETVGAFKEPTASDLSE
jgi:peptidoglycan/xylan/chitin deacetylase (PgdA/CDA1 family)